jgi:hypothetical protein
VGAARLLLFLKTTSLGKLYELERVHISSLYDCSNPQYTPGDCSMG